jgi:aspartyl-tRNA(Asn)/glutamyl-tRNA(Gln) amidotransferase subunit C
VKLTLAEVEHIAELARLSLSEDEKALYQEQLSAILEYAERLQALDTSAIPPTATVLPLRSVMRADEPRDSMSRDDVLANAPQVEAESFRVQAVMD